eukprot:comp104353_c0_seq1/m.48760 comp104353_c0_seq1/g.48760  ORF comp104353_c0_seq1/g.48760 comp104353_c0_seq1/m.48760 type:complete len:337 (-) comp104353_c0_seq1:1-1011(-)
MSFLFGDPFTFGGPVQRGVRSPRSVYHPPAYGYYDDYDYPSAYPSRSCDPYHADYEQPVYAGGWGRTPYQQIRQPRMTRAQYEELQRQKYLEALRVQEEQREAVRRRVQQQQAQTQHRGPVSSPRQTQHSPRSQHLAEQQRKQIERRALFLRYTNAARTIQRWFRNIAQPAIQQRREAAAKIAQWYHNVKLQRAERARQAELRRQSDAATKITHVVRTVAERQKAQKVTSSVKKLREIFREADKLRTDFYDKVFTKPVYDERGKVNYSLIGYIDFLEKLILKTDDIPTLGSELIRERRKSTVKHIQKYLAEADTYRKEGPQHPVVEEKMEIDGEGQ